jgi:SAM-dependent methyltransferase
MAFGSMGYILILLMIFKRPLNQAVSFWTHYPEFMMYLLAVYLITSSVRLEEWVRLVIWIPYAGVGLSAVIIVFPTGIASALTSITRATEAKSLSNPRSWYSPSRTRYRLESQLDKLEIWIPVFVETAFQLFFLLTKWRRTLSITSTQKKMYDSLSLNDVYDIDFFPQIYDLVFGERPVTKEWQHMIEKHVLPGKTVLDLGAGPGRLSLLMASLGASVDAIERNSYFADLLRKRAKERFGENHICVLETRFPNDSRASRYDTVVLHQNVMLELINEIGTEATWRALQSVALSGGVVLFDYPLRIRVPQPGQKVMLLDSTFPHFGHVQYGYVYEGINDGFHQANVTLTTVTNQGTAMTRNCTMRGTAPEVSGLLLDGERAGFYLDESLSTEAYTFFPSDMQVYALRLSHGG